MPLQTWLGISRPYYTLHRCLMCPSRENWLADLALADNHAGATSDTVLVARTNKGYDLLRHAAAKDFVELTEVNNRQAEEIVTRTKFIPALSYISWRKQKGYPVPFYDYDQRSIFSERSWMYRYLQLLKYRMFIVVRKEWLLDILIKRPVLMEKIGIFINNFPRSIPAARTAVRFIKKIFVFLRHNRTNG